ncbi:hypothetical protein WJX84_006266 [Apatococcus fuscideae]|uniref:Uncharacterized protein n=1 Tax=Apatococcus fuscideae TaxID=2026836 RepID=A0AAW1T3Z0_9CHLO
MITSETQEEQAARAKLQQLYNWQPARRRRQTSSMEDNQRRSQRPRSRKEDPDFLFIADMDMPRLKNLDSAYQAAVAASLAASQPQPSDSRAKQRAYTSLNSHPASSKAHHIDSTSFTRELGLLPSCKRRRSVCEAAMAMAIDAGQQIFQAQGQATSQRILKHLSLAEDNSPHKLVPPAC